MKSLYNDITIQWCHCTITLLYSEVTEQLYTIQWSQCTMILLYNDVTAQWCDYTVKSLHTDITLKCCHCPKMLPFNDDTVHW